MKYFQPEPGTRISDLGYFQVVPYMQVGGNTEGLDFSLEFQRKCFEKVRAEDVLKVMQRMEEDLAIEPCFARATEVEIDTTSRIRRLASRVIASLK